MRAHPSSGRPRLWRSLISLAFLAGLGGLGCEAGPAVEPGGAAARLEDARRRWGERPFADYSFHLQQLCFCPSDYVRPVRLVVRDGDVVEATFLDDSEPRAGDPEMFPTIEELFDRLASAREQEAEVLDVEYDAELGHPTSARVDISSQMADEELSFTVSEVEAAGEPAATPE